MTNFEILSRLYGLLEQNRDDYTLEDIAPLMGIDELSTEEVMKRFNMKYDQCFIKKNWLEEAVSLGEEISTERLAEVIVENLTKDENMSEYLYRPLDPILIEQDIQKCHMFNHKDEESVIELLAKMDEVGPISSEVSDSSYLYLSRAYLYCTLYMTTWIQIVRNQGSLKPLDDRKQTQLQAITLIADNSRRLNIRELMYESLATKDIKYIIRLFNALKADQVELKEILEYRKSGKPKLLSIEEIAEETPIDVAINSGLAELNFLEHMIDMSGNAAIKVEWLKLILLLEVDSRNMSHIIYYTKNMEDLFEQSIKEIPEPVWSEFKSLGINNIRDLDKINIQKIAKLTDKVIDISENNYRRIVSTHPSLGNVIFSKQQPTPSPEQPKHSPVKEIDWETLSINRFVIDVVREASGINGGTAKTLAHELKYRLNIIHKHFLENNNSLKSYIHFIVNLIEMNRKIIERNGKINYSQDFLLTLSEMSDKMLGTVPECLMLYTEKDIENYSLANIQEFRKTCYILTEKNNIDLTDQSDYDFS